MKIVSARLERSVWTTDNPSDYTMRELLRQIMQTHDTPTFYSPESGWITIPAPPPLCYTEWDVTQAYASTMGV